MAHKVAKCIIEGELQKTEKERKGKEMEANAYETSKERLQF